MSPYLIVNSTLHKKDSEEYFDKWESLFCEFRSNQTWWKRQFYSVFMVRRLLFVLCTVFLIQWPVVQATLAFVLSCIVKTTQQCSFVVVVRPYKTTLAQVPTIISELATLLIFGLVLMSILDQDLMSESSLSQPYSWSDYAFACTVYFAWCVL